MDAYEWISKNKNKIINILFLALSLFVAGKIYGSQLKGRDLLTEKKDRESKKNVILESISGTEKKIEAYRKLLGDKDASGVINAIGNMANQTGVKITSIRPAKQEKFPEYVKIPYKLELATQGYHSLGRFLSRLESHADIFMVDTIELRAEERTKDLKAILTLSLIFYK